MSHAFAAHATVRNLHTATIADHALVLHPTVLAASALPVLFRSENTLAKQTVFFRTVGTVVDRFRLFDFAERPTTDVLRASQRDLYRGEIVDAVVSNFSCRHKAFAPGSGVSSCSRGLGRDYVCML